MFTFLFFYVGKNEEYEVDFVAQDGIKTVYYQVALTAREQSTLERELRALQSIKDHCPKYLLTLDEQPQTQFNGIKCINARDWLLGLTD